MDRIFIKMDKATLYLHNCPKNITFYNSSMNTSQVQKITATAPKGDLWFIFYRRTFRSLKGHCTKL